MSIPTFMDLQGFTVGRRFIVKKFAVLKNGIELSHYIFGCPEPWSNLTKAERQQTMWLIDNHHGLRWEDGMIPYSEAKPLIRKAVMGATTTDDDKIVMYIKRHEKRGWLQDLLLDQARQYKKTKK